MPPNTQQEEMSRTSFIHHFWSKDKSGMNNLLSYIKTTHADLDVIYQLYTQRSQLEKEFGEKLLVLSKTKQKDSSTVSNAIAMELEKTATSHVELSTKVRETVANELEQKMEEYRSLLEKWNKTLEELYVERQEKTNELLKIRAKYLREHDKSAGQSTSTMEILKSQYKELVTEVDELSQEWNSAWQDACEVMEAMEEDRIEFLKSNVWEYANLASTRLLVEDEWCEVIRKQLETYSVEHEIEVCIQKFGTGSKIPSTNDYVGEQKKRNATAPTPPMKPLRKDERKDPEERRQAMHKERTKKEETIVQEEHVTQKKERISDNVGSTASRGQVKRKPLSKSLMNQVSDQMAIARQQREQAQDPPLKKSSSNGSLESLLQTFEVMNKSPSPPNATVSEEAKSRRQPSEYKPDTGSIPRKGTMKARMLQEMSTSENINTQFPIDPPKSPRPPAQQIDLAQQQQTYYQPSPNIMHQQIHSQQQHIQSPMMQPQLQQAMLQQQAPRSPMIQQQRSPMMQPQRSPMMQPAQFGTQRGLPPPITIPVTNYSATPQPSPSMSYSNIGGVSPGGILPPPVLPYRPHTFSDGRAIISWARAKYDYTATEMGELSFAANSLIGIVEADMTQQSWWTGAIWDEYRHTWASSCGSIPSNFMTNA